MKVNFYPLHFICSFFLNTLTLCPFLVHGKKNISKPWGYGVKKNKTGSLCFFLLTFGKPGTVMSACFWMEACYKWWCEESPIIQLENRSDYLSLVWPVNFLKERQSSYSINCDAKSILQNSDKYKKKTKTKTNLKTNKLDQIVSFLNITIFYYLLFIGVYCIFPPFVILKFILNAQEG